MLRFPVHTTRRAAAVAVLGTSLLLGQLAAAQADPGTGNVTPGTGGVDVVVTDPGHNGNAGGGNSGGQNNGPGGNGGNGGNGGGNGGPAPCTPGGAYYDYLPESSIDYRVPRESGPPAGQTAADGQWYGKQMCVTGAQPGFLGWVWVPNGAAVPAPPPPPPTGREVGLAAMANLDVAPLRIQSSPPSAKGGIVRVPTWFWSDIGELPRTARAATGGRQNTRASAVVAPKDVTITTDDGATITCGINGDLLGTPYPRGGDPAAASPDCGHTYLHASDGFDVHIKMRTTVTWTVTSGPTSDGQTTGTFDPDTGDPTPVYEGAVNLRVVEVQTIN